MGRLASGLDLSAPRRPRQPIRQPASADQRRRALLGKVHVARKALGLVEDDYRQILLDETGKMSAADCTEAQLIRVVERFKKRGWADAPRAQQRGPRPADHPAARKARALWISLHQLAVVADPSERALESFARRQLKCAQLQWANQALAHKLIEALKAMAERAGWSQDTTGLSPAIIVPELRARLVARIRARLVELDWIPSTWTVADAARQLCGIETAGNPAIWNSTVLDQVAAGLGAELRRAVQHASHDQQGRRDAGEEE